MRRGGLSGGKKEFCDTTDVFFVRRRIFCRISSQGIMFESSGQLLMHLWIVDISKKI